MRAIKGLFCFIPCLFLLTTSAYSGDPNLLVDFTCKGKAFSIQGKEVERGKFVFNEGAPKSIWITTLDWMPYIGQNICKQGWVQQFAVALFATRGYEVVSTFYPWARTISVAENGQADVLYPEWYIEESAPSDVHKGRFRRENLALSRPFPGGPVVFMKRKGESIPFDGDLAALKGESISVVRGYQNTPEFDALMDRGYFEIHEANNDLMQAKLLWKKRVNLIINDPNVVRYTIIHSGMEESRKESILNTLEVVKPVIKYNHLYFAVSKKKPGWEDTLNMINQGIEEFTSSGLLFDIMQKTSSQCGYDIKETLVPYQE